jgi:hypothetical protein
MAHYKDAAQGTTMISPHAWPPTLLGARRFFVGSAALACGVAGFAADAATLRAASCSRTDVASAVASASAGDTVVVPAGTCSWSGGISISGIQLVGAGKSASGTVITAGRVNMTKHNSSVTRLSGFRFAGTDQHIEAGGAPSARPYVIDNNYIRADVSGWAVHFSANGGLFHHNEVTAVNWTNNAVFGIQTSEDWSQAPTFGADDSTGERNTYFEDNVYTNVAEVALDGDVGSRVVIRYNTYNDSSITFHGGAPSDSSPNGGVRQFEVYNNTFNRISNAIPVNKWLWVRGGTGVVANNVMARADSPDGSSYPNKSELRLTLACPGAYPVQYQVGQSSPTPQSPPSRPLLIFGNTGAGASDGNFISVASSDTAGGSCGSPANYIQQGRDYVLSNAWGWRAYTYPHPLQGVQAGSSPPPAPASLAPPSNLVVR